MIREGLFVFASELPQSLLAVLHEFLRTRQQCRECAKVFIMGYGFYGDDDYRVTVYLVIK